MRPILRKRMAIATGFYWLLLAYIIAALIWWFISLMHQNHQMTNLKLLELSSADPAYLSKVNDINAQERRKMAQYTGEGITFMVLIALCAAFLYRSVRQQFRNTERQQNFMMAITHELKTPIAVAKLNLETLQKHKLPEEKQEKIIRMTLQETNRLNDLCNNILVSSQLEEHSYASNKERVDFSALIATSVNEYAGRFPDRSWDVNVQPNIYLNGDLLLLQILVNNLVDNAVKYSAKNSALTIKLANADVAIEFSVADQGIGIPEIEKQRVFQRFYRIGNESVRKTKGTGLGLYLCSKIAADHHALINVRNNLPTGTIFIVQFPHE